MLTHLSVLTTYLTKRLYLEPSTHVKEGVAGSRRRQHKVSGVEERLKNVTTVQRSQRSTPHSKLYTLMPQS